ncbi:MAG: hypothetical protein UHY68_08620 [Acutalibacteraceae bacterium]|nr:hypothetical protein [Acutalibacteraceae bacterium]
MSSTNKTAYLKLNSWLGTDRPQRIDFVDDNTIIDKAIKDHVQNTTVHCTSTEKAKIENPYTILSYTGTGEATNEIQFTFAPKMAIVFSKDSPSMKTDSSGNTIINQAIVAKSNGGTGGAVINGYNVKVTQSTSATNGMFFNLNKYNSQYCIIAFL